MNKDVERILFSEEEIHQRSVEVGKQLTDLYQGADSIVVVALLKGSFPFLSEIIKRIDVPMTIEFMRASSYSGSRSGELNIKQDLDCDISNKHVLIVEDIVDTGKTLKLVKQMLLDRGAASVKVVTMLDKVEGRVVPFEADYVCFDCPNEFVIGYGLDYNERYRELPYVGVLKEEVYK